MDVLWAPWRMKYILYESVEKDKECFICRGFLSPSEDNLVLYRGADVIVMMNKYPYNTGHLLVAPSRHVPSLEELSREEICSLFETVRNTLTVLRRALNPDGFNIGLNLGRVAGAGLEEHVHVHVVPRWSGDTNFMPVIADTKVIPEALKDTYQRIRKHVDLLLEKR